MAVVFLTGTLSLSGLHLESTEEMYILRAKIIEAVRSIHPGGRVSNTGEPLMLQGDVDFDIDEHAGTFEPPCCEGMTEAAKGKPHEDGSITLAEHA